MAPSTASLYFLVGSLTCRTAKHRLRCHCSPTWPLPLVFCSSCTRLGVFSSHTKSLRSAFEFPKSVLKALAILLVTASGGDVQSPVLSFSFSSKYPKVQQELRQPALDRPQWPGWSRAAAPTAPCVSRKVEVVWKAVFDTKWSSCVLKRTWNEHFTI